MILSDVSNASANGRFWHLPDFGRSLTYCKSTKCAIDQVAVTIQPGARVPLLLLESVELVAQAVRHRRKHVGDLGGAFARRDFEPMELCADIVVGMLALIGEAMSQAHEIVGQLSGCL
jgi:hypothetical protein